MRIFPVQLFISEIDDFVMMTIKNICHKEWELCIFCDMYDIHNTYPHNTTYE